MAAQSPSLDQAAVLSEILTTLHALQSEQRQLSSAVDGINGRVNTIAGIQQVKDLASRGDISSNQSSHAAPASQLRRPADETKNNSSTPPVPSSPSLSSVDGVVEGEHPMPVPSKRRASTTSRIILTTYPGQSGIDPMVLSWGHKDPALRGPVVVSRGSTTIRRRNGA